MFNLNKTAVNKNNIRYMHLTKNQQSINLTLFNKKKAFSIMTRIVKMR